MTKTLHSSASVLDSLASRKRFYDMLAVFYRNSLSQEQIDIMAELDFASFDTDEPLLEQGFDDIRRYLRKRNTGTRQALATDYTSAFAGVKTIEEKTAIPCASLFLSGIKHFYAEQRGIVLNIYKKELVRLSEGVNLPEDHLAFELEFLGIMSENCLEALQADDVQTAIRKLDVSKDFIENHILNWFEKFESVANEIIETRFYRGVIRITKGYLLFDLKTIEDLRDVLSPEIKE